jgi:hypothetical protein
MQNLYADITKKAVSEENVRKYYDDLAKELIAKKAVRIRYISVKTQKDADTIYKILAKSPKSFTNQAKRKSFEEKAREWLSPDQAITGSVASVAAASASAASTALAAGLSAAGSAAVTSAASMMTINTINNQGHIGRAAKQTTSKESLENIAITAVTAGVVAGAVSALGGSPSLERGSYEDSKMGVNVERGVDGNVYPEGYVNVEGRELNGLSRSSYNSKVLSPYNNNPVMRSFNTIPTVKSGVTLHDANMSIVQSSSSVPSASVSAIKFTTAIPYLSMNSCAASTELCSVLLNKQPDLMLDDELQGEEW